MESTFLGYGEQICRHLGAALAIVALFAVCGSNDVMITWNLDGGTGWTFDKNKGIDFKNKKNWVPKYVSPTQYNAKNKKENGSQSYKYEINLENGSTKLSWDPTIMN